MDDARRGTMSDQGALALSFNFSIFRNLFKSFFSNALFPRSKGPGGVKTKCAWRVARVNAMEFPPVLPDGVRSVEASFAKLRSPVAASI